MAGAGAFEAFTVIAGKRQELKQADNVGAALIKRIRRFSLAAHLDPELSLLCCQARAASAYLHQVRFALCSVSASDQVRFEIVEAG